MGLDNLHRTASFSLAELGIVDAPAEEDFDNLTALACSIISAPVSLVSIVQPELDRQYFKSQVGLPEPWAAERETPLSHSFCQHVVAQDKTLNIPNAPAHPLVSTNKAIEDLGVAAYLGAPIYDQRGDPAGALCVIDSNPRLWSGADVIAIEQLARCVSNAIRLKAELKTSERLREEMAEFTYALSHDLKAPSNTIHLLVEGICNELGANGSDEVLHLTRLTLDTSNRMRTTIEDVLGFIVALENEIESETVDLNRLLDDVTSDLQCDIESAGATVDIGPLPKTTGSAVQLRLLFQNLVANAVKFRREEVTPLISVRSEPLRSGGIRIAVADNGIGIPADRFEQIFSLFERLHNSHNSRYPGTGIGLTLCRRIVENHKGVLEVESTPGEGSVFVVELPSHPLAS